MRRTRVRVAAWAAAVGLGGAWAIAADPAWVRDAGLDFWNVARLRAELADQTARADQLDDAYTDAAARMRRNEALTQDVAAGRLTLADAAAAMWETNRRVRGFETDLGRFGCPTPVAGCARLLLRRIETDDGLAAEARAAAVARLRAEYAVAFGPLPPAADQTA